MAEMHLEYSPEKRTRRWLLNIIWNACLLVKSTPIGKIYLYVINRFKYSKPLRCSGLNRQYEVIIRPPLDVLPIPTCEPFIRFLSLFVSAILNYQLENIYVYNLRSTRDFSTLSYIINLHFKSVFSLYNWILN